MRVSSELGGLSRCGVDELLRSRLVESARGEARPPTVGPGIFVSDTVDAAVWLVAKRRFVRSSLPGPETARRRIVLHNIIVPITHPKRPVRPNFSANRRSPFIIARGKIAAIVRDEVRAARFEMKLPEQMAGWLIHKLNAVPIFFRKIARRIDGAACAGCVTAMIVHLAHFFSERIKALAVCDCFKAAGRPAIDGFVISVGDRHIHAGVPIGSRAEDEIVLGDPQTPGVIVAGTYELQFRPVRFKTKNSLAKADILSTDGSAETRVTDCSPNPVIETIAQVAGGRVRVTHAPTSKKHSTFVRLVIAVSVFENLGLARMNYNDASIGEDEARRNTQLVSENRELVGTAVAVCVLTNLEPVMTLACRLQIVGIIDGLCNPEPAPFVPRHPDCFDDIRVARKETCPEFGESYQMTHRLGGLERLLHGANRLSQSAPLCVRRVIRKRRRRIYIVT